MNDKLINFSFTVEQTNAILNALGQLPYAQAYPLVEMVMQQGHEQALAIIKQREEAAGENSKEPANAAA